MLLFLKLHKSTENPGKYICSMVPKKVYTKHNIQNPIRNGLRKCHSYIDMYAFVQNFLEVFYKTFIAASLMRVIKGFALNDLSIMPMMKDIGTVVQVLGCILFSLSWISCWCYLMIFFDM